MMEINNKKSAVILLFILIVLFIGAMNSAAEIVPASRRIPWNPGIPDEFPMPMNTVNVRDYGAKGDGITDDYNAFSLAIKDFLTNQGIVFIPAGTYRIKNTLLLDSRIALVGEGPDKSKILFDFGGQEKNGIEIVQYQRGKWLKVLSEHPKDSKRIVVENGSGFQAGDFIEIQQKNDSTLFYDKETWSLPWAQNAVGQILVLDGVKGDTLSFTDPLYLDYHSALQPVVRKQQFVKHVDIENLMVERLDNGKGYNIQIKNSAYCRIKNVESKNAVTAHVFFETAYACEAVQNYFHHALWYGSGDYGHGIVCSFHSTNNLIENNIFQSLRHSVVMGLGASGNVFGYNYSVEPHKSGDTTFADIAVQGLYPNNNLFESNSVHEIAIGQYAGSAGPGNTFLRNQIISVGFTVQNRSHSQNLVGNVFESEKAQLTISTAVKNTLAHGNKIGGTVLWDPGIPDRAIPASYYRFVKPSFFGNQLWPLFGPDKNLGEPLPAQTRYDNMKTGVRRNPMPAEIRFDVYPNPFNESTRIVYHLQSPSAVKFTVYDLLGRQIAALTDEPEKKKSGTIGLSSSVLINGPVCSGLYLIRMETDQLILMKKIMFLK